MAISRAVRSTLAAALLLPMLTTTPATAAPRAQSGSTDSCRLRMSWIDGSGARMSNYVTSTPSAGLPRQGPRLYGRHEAGSIGSWGYEPLVPAGNQYHGLVVVGRTLYESSYATDGDDQTNPTSITRRRIGGGWTTGYVEESKYFEGGQAMRNRRHNVYMLNGFINRWTVTSKGWVGKKSYPNFGAVKTMALISQQRGYDTFLANTFGGALYTIRIPLTGAPVVTRVRSRTWQGFETLIAEKCGRQSTLLLAIDQDGGNSLVYAMSHANGPATTFKLLGKIPHHTPLGTPVAREYLDNEYTQMLNGD